MMTKELQRRAAWFIAAILLSPWTGVLGCGDDGSGGNNNNNQNTSPPICGDGRLDPGEECDDGPLNSDLAPDACRSDCRSPFCGDDVADTGEACDDGPNNSDVLANACRTDCSLPTCGDGVIDPGEECDDGNLEVGDGCLSNCQVGYYWRCEGAPSQCECLDYRRGLGCAECVVYVNVDPSIETRDGSTWETAYADVQSGIDTAFTHGPGCEVWVAGGIYAVFQDSPGNTVELRDGVAVYGGFAGGETLRSERDILGNPTILDGSRELNGEGHRVFHVVTGVDTAGAVLDGLTVRYGGAVGFSETLDDRGGGLLLDGSVVTLQNNVFRYNTAVQGGALFAYASAVTIRTTLFQSNEARDSGGALYGVFGGTVIEDTVFAQNEAAPSGGEGGTGGGAVFQDCSPEISGTLFLENTTGNDLAGGGGAIAHLGSTVSQITDSYFVLNRSLWDGGALLNQGPVALSAERCVFLHNAAEGVGRGGALCADGGSSGTLSQVSENDFVDSFFLGNDSGLGGTLEIGAAAHTDVVNGVFVDNGAPTGELLFLSSGAQGARLTNCTHWGRTGTAVQYEGTALEVANSVLWNGPGSGLPALTGAGATVTHSVVQNLAAPGPTVYVTDPGLLAPPGTPLATGTWSSVSSLPGSVVVTLEDAAASWQPGEHVGRLVHSGQGWLIVTANTATTLTTLGAPSLLASPGDPYQIHDLHPGAGSICIDRGDDGAALRPAEDRTGQPWVDDPNEGDPGTTTDIGAYESP